MSRRRLIALGALVLAGCAAAEPDEPRQPAARPVLTRLPVDMQRLLAPPWRQDRLPIRPFFDYSNTNHAEGPRKWYLYAWDRAPLAVVCPCDARAGRHEVRRSDRSAEIEVGGERAVTDIQLRLRVTPQVEVFFMHLCIRADLLRRLEGASSIELPAGSALGWIHNPPTNSLDFGIQDRGAPAGMTHDASSWWDTRVNPLDYLAPALRREVLRLHAPLAAQLATWGSEPFSDLADSRSNVLVAGRIWGVWFRADLDQPFARHRVDWATINLIPRRWLHAASFASELRAHPRTAGLMTENGHGERAGPALYPGGPIGHSRLIVLGGDDREGRGRIESRFDPARAVHLRWKVRGGPDPAGRDDRLVLESYRDADALAASTGFSSAALTFVRQPER